MDLGSLWAYGEPTSRMGWAKRPFRRLFWSLGRPFFHGAGIEITKEIAQNFHVAGVETTKEIAQSRAEILANVDALMHNTLASMHDALASQLGGLHKDIGAVAARLAGLEEEAEAAAGVSRTVQTLAERLDKMALGAPVRAGDRITIGDTGLVIVGSPRGVRLLVRQRDHIGRMIADGQEWEPHIREAIERAAQPGAIAIDAGAYIGVHTLTMARWFDTVHAFEPQRGIYQMLCGNLALNCCMNVITHNAALYDRTGWVRLAPQERQETAAPIHNGLPDYAHIDNAAALSFDFDPDGGEVPAITIDGMELENVALIKVDAQGADLRVLRGATDTIRRSRPVVLFEWERDLGRQHGATLDDFLAFFAGLDYEVAIIHDTTPGRQADYLAKPR